MGIRLSRTAMALIAGVVGYLVTIHFVFAALVRQGIRQLDDQSPAVDEP